MPLSLMLRFRSFGVRLVQWMQNLAVLPIRKRVFQGEFETSSLMISAHGIAVSILNDTGSTSTFSRTSARTRLIRPQQMARHILHISRKVDLRQI